MNLRSWLILLTLGLGAGRQLHSSIDDPEYGNDAYDCSTGCSTRLQVVTDVEGTAFANGCLAFCQGVKISKELQQTTEGTIFGWPRERFDEQTTVSLDIITQYQPQGFNFIAKVNLYDIPLTAADEDDFRDSSSSSSSSSSSLLHGITVTSEGYVYVETTDNQLAVPLECAAGSQSCHSPGWLPDQNASAINLVASQPGLRFVWGFDDRKLVDPRLFPFRTVGRISSNFEEFTGLCTGALIGPSTVLTAAHCVFNRKTQKWAQSLVFTPGQWGRSTFPFGSATSTSFTTYRGFIDSGDFGFDIAVVRLDQDIGNRAGWLGFGYDCNIWTYDFTTAGYPADLPEDLSDLRGYYMYMNECTASNNYNNCRNEPNSTFTHLCDTLGGQDGSPMWVQWADSQGVVDHVILGVDVRNRDPMDIWNIAKQLTSVDFQKIKEWQAL